MLHLLYGKDSLRSRQKLNELLDFFRSKKENSRFFRMDEENFSIEEFEGFLKSKSLFGGKNIIVCAGLLENKAASNFILKNLNRCANSDSIFLFLGKEISDELLTPFKENSEKIQKFDLFAGAKVKKWMQDEAEKRKIKLPADIQEKIAEKCGNDLWCVSSEIELYSLGGEIESATVKEKYNPFQICDAVASRDRKTSWILLQKALLNGVPAEEVFWKIVWQIKNLLMIKRLAVFPHLTLEKETKLHPFVIKKNLYSIRNFTQEELNQLSWNLVELYHKIRKGQAEFEIGLEKILISL